MAFCNTCGATLNPGTKFCNKCGAAIAPGAETPAAAPAAPAPTPVPTGGSSALKVILIVVAIIVAFGILGIATVGIIGYRIARHAHVDQNGDHVKVETPFGSVETSKDPDQAAKDLGIDLYPGAQVQRSGSSSAAFGGIRTVSAVFETPDSPDKVCSFYKPKFPGAMVTTSDQNHCSIVSNTQKNMVTINIHSSGDRTRIQITNVTKKSSD
ncbi:MAG TPA: zinc ribbon domain-containing protein [Candidatus Sulfotelmatobacter sp.]|nr:zinc ribbon domain-containing protein [Candidatus Sulfotelmatobacter sp.]